MSGMLSPVGVSIHTLYDLPNRCMWGQMLSRLLSELNSTASW